MKSKSYPGVHNAEVHPRAGNIKKHCELCSKIGVSSLGNMRLQRCTDGSIHLAVWHIDYAASACSDEDVYVCGTTEKVIKFCPECGRKL